MQPTCKKRLKYKAPQVSKCTLEFKYHIHPMSLLTGRPAAAASLVDLSSLYLPAFQEKANAVGGLVAAARAAEAVRRLDPAAVNGGVIVFHMPTPAALAAERPVASVTYMHNKPYAIVRN
jgi:hypothetical protein